MTTLQMLESVKISLIEIQNQCAEASKIGNRVSPEDIEEMLKALRSTVNLASAARKEISMAIQITEDAVYF